jgi:hypothetical protein
MGEGHTNPPLLSFVEFGALSILEQDCKIINNEKKEFLLINLFFISILFPCSSFPNCSVG